MTNFMSSSSSSSFSFFSSEAFMASMAQQGKDIRKVARLAACSFAVAAEYYTANGGDLKKAVKVIKEVR